MEMFTISESGIFIRGAEVCWRCGRRPPAVRLTTHHGIPQTLQPQRNVEIPICEDCHDELNKQDIMQVLQFIYKLQKEAQALNSTTAELVKKIQKANSIVTSLIKNEEHDKQE